MDPSNPEKLVEEKEELKHAARKYRTKSCKRNNFILSHASLLSCDFKFGNWLCLLPSFTSTPKRIFGTK